MAPVWGSVADKYGKRKMFIRSGVGIALSYILMAFATNQWQFLFLRGFNGLLGGFIPAAIMLVATNTPELELGYALGILNTFVALGSIMGPFIGGSLVHFLSIKTTFIFSAGLLGLATILAFFGTKEKIIKQSTPTIIWKELRNILHDKALTVYFFAMTTLQTAIYMVQPILPLRIGELVTTNKDFITGLVFSIMGVSLAIGSPLVSKIKKKNYANILFWGLVMCGLFSMGQGATYSILLLIIARFLFGFANGAVNVSGNVLISQATPEEMRGKVFGALNGLTALGAVIGPLLGGFLGETFGTASAFYGSGLLFFVAGFFVWKLNSCF